MKLLCKRLRKSATLQNKGLNTSRYYDFRRNSDCEPVMEMSMNLSLNRLIKVTIKSLALTGSLWLISPSSYAQVAPEVGSGAPFNNPRGTGQDAIGNLIVADFGTGNIIRVDRFTGDRELLSDSSSDAQGPQLAQPAGVVVLEGDRIFVTDLALDSVFEIDPVSGDRTLLTEGILGPFGITSGLIDGVDTLIVSSTGSPTDGDEVGPVLVNPDTGEITLIPVPEGNTIQFNDSRSVAYIVPAL